MKIERDKPWSQLPSLSLSLQGAPAALFQDCLMDVREGSGSGVERTLASVILSLLAPAECTDLVRDVILACCKETERGFCMAPPLLENTGGTQGAPFRQHP